VAETEGARIYFLVYFSRSGSTFLASRLDRYDDVGVTVESNFARPLISGRLAGARDAGEVHDLLSTEGRFENLGLSRGDLATYLPEDGPYGAGEIARAVLAALAAKKKPSAKVWIVKDGANGYWIERLARAIPDARFVHVVRDGRAVLNSQLQAVRPYGQGERMARDPLTVARLWSRFVSGVDAFAAGHPERCLTCRYEDLVSDEKGEVDRVRAFLGLPEATEAAGEARDYYEAIPEKEKALHGLVAGAAVPGRADAWRDELPRGARLVFEHRAARALERHGYSSPGRRLTRLLLDPDFTGTYARSVALRAWSWTRFATEPGKLRRAVETKLLHKGGRP
jgi:hypothetical protein